MGILALYQKDYAGAEKLFGEMYNANAGDFFASNNLALALIEAEPVDDTEKGKADAKAKHDRAVGLAEVNVRAFPRSADAIATLGWIYFKQNRLDEAQQALSQAIQGTNGQATPSTAYYLANVFTKRNRLDDAVKVLVQALQFQGPFPYRKEAELMLKRYRPDMDLDELKPKPAEKADKSNKDKTSATKASDGSKKTEPAKKSAPPK